MAVSVEVAKMVGQATERRHVRVGEDGDPLVRSGVSPNHPAARFRQICYELGFNKKYVVHSLRKYWASTVAQQGMDAMLMIKAYGHTDYQLILKVYYAQNDDEGLLDEASKIDLRIDGP